MSVIFVVFALSAKHLGYFAVYINEGKIPKCFEFRKVTQWLLGIHPGYVTGA